jgi:hypothetical protein
MADEGITFLRQEIREAKTDEERLSAMLVLEQLLLLTDKREEYAEHVVDELLPLATRTLPNRDAMNGWVAVTLFPLAVDEFAESLPEKLVHKLSEKMNTMLHRDDDLGFASQAVLKAFAQRLHDTALTERADGQLAKHPARSRWLQGENRDVDMDLLYRIRFGFIMPELLAEAFGR